MSAPEDILGALAAGTKTLLESVDIDGVTMGGTIEGGPDRLVALTPYWLEYDRSSGRCRIGMSIRLRVAEDDGSGALTALSGAVFATLADLEHVVIGGLHVSVVEWWTSQPFGTDSSGRPEVVDTYHFTCARPSRVATLSQ